MAISLAISITRFHSRRVDVIKRGYEEGVEDRGGWCGWRGGAVLAQSTVNAWLLESLKKPVRRKLHDQISFFLQVNEELGFPFSALNGSREVWALRKVCLTTVSI